MLYVLLLLATETAPCAEEAIKRSLPLEQIVFKDTQIIHIYLHIHIHTSFQAQFNPTDSPCVYSQIEKHEKGTKCFDERSQCCFIVANETCFLLTNCMSA